MKPFLKSCAAEFKEGAMLFLAMFVAALTGPFVGAYKVFDKHMNTHGTHDNGHHPLNTN